MSSEHTCEEGISSFIWQLRKLRLREVLSDIIRTHSWQLEPFPFGNWLLCPSKTYHSYLLDDVSACCLVESSDPSVHSWTVFKKFVRKVFESVLKTISNKLIIPSGHSSWRSWDEMVASEDVTFQVWFSCLKDHTASELRRTLRIIRSKLLIL